LGKSQNLKHLQICSHSNVNATLNENANEFDIGCVTLIIKP